MSCQSVKTIVLGCLLAACIHAATPSANTTLDLSFDMRAESYPLITGLQGFELICGNCTVSGKVKVVQGSVDGSGVDNFVSGGFLDILLSDFSSTISLNYSLAPGVSVNNLPNNTVNPIALPGGLSVIQNVTIPGFGTMNATVQLSVIPLVTRYQDDPPVPVNGDLNFTTGFQSPAGATIETYLNLTHNFQSLSQSPNQITEFNLSQSNALQFDAPQLLPQRLSIKNVLQANITVWFNTQDNGYFGHVSFLVAFGALDMTSQTIPNSDANCLEVFDHTDKNSFQDAMQMVPLFFVDSYAAGFKPTSGYSYFNGIVSFPEHLVNLPAQCLIPNGNNTGLMLANPAQLSAAASFRAYSGTFFSLLLVWSIAWML